MLVDAQGKIAYDAEGMDEDELRKEIAKLGPEYALVAEAKADSVCGFQVKFPCSSASSKDRDDKRFILLMLLAPLFFFCHFPPKNRMSSPKAT
jgi:hypothetical protein